jgi:serine phosphatase RsbU (regulator of sigma subunit)
MASFLKSPKISLQLLFWFLIIEFPAEVALTFVSYKSAEKSLNEEVTNSLKAISTRQANQITSYLEDQLRNVNTLSNLPDVVKATNDLNLVFSDSNQFLIHQQKHKDVLLYYRKSFNYTGLRIISKEGNMLFSSKLEELQDNVLNGKLKGTELANIFQRVSTIQQSEISDFSYLPESQEPTAFVGAPIKFERKLIGILVLEINNQEIKKVVNDYVGLGETGETILISKFGDKALFTADTRHDNHAGFQRTSPLDGTDIAVMESLSGKSGNAFTKDYRGKEVLAAWSYIPDLRSGLIVKIDTTEAFASVARLQRILFAIIIGTMLLVIFAAFMVARSISKPIRVLTFAAKKMSEGDLSSRVTIKEKNEIGTLANTFNEMAESIEKNKEKLLTFNRELEVKVTERTKELHAKAVILEKQAKELKEEKEETAQLNEELNQMNEELGATLEKVQKQKELIESKNSNIIASITYAKRIQEAILPPDDLVKFRLPESFILFLPKDIVSGDFYWCSSRNDKVIIAAIDCTGHGVPGAFMSVIGDSLMNQIVNISGITSPDEILRSLKEGVERSLKQDENDNRDGMDVALCVIDRYHKKLEFAGARNPLYYVEGDEVKIEKGDAISIGREARTKERDFSKKTIHLDIPRMYYIFSDGFVDQFGGIKGHDKYTAKRFKEKLLEIHHLPMDAQKQFLFEDLENWRGEEKQTDDIMVIGFKV